MTTSDALGLLAMASGPLGSGVDPRPSTRLAEMVERPSNSSSPHPPHQHRVYHVGDARAGTQALGSRTRKVAFSRDPPIRSGY